MIVMRERSGRSGRRRGSQKPGTAIGSAVTAGVFGTFGPTVEGGGPSCRGDCARATETVAISATMTQAPPRRRHVLSFDIIRWPSPESGGPYHRRGGGLVTFGHYALVGEAPVRCFSISCTG